jgi:4-amino-4-deoxy-L-arabinose transferase-like glycosyltransferase
MKNTTAAKSHWIYLAVLLLMLLGAALRLITLKHEALFADELFSRNIAVQTLPHAIEMVREDLVRPPLYYLLLKGAISIGGADAFCLRSLSLLCGIASIGLIAILGYRLPGARWCGLLAAAGMAVSQQEVYYSQEAQPFAFYTMLVVLLVLWIEAISRRQRDPRLWIAGFFLMLLLLYTHYMGSLYVAAAVLTLLVCKLETRTKVLAVASAAGAALLFAPWLMAISSVYREKHGIGSTLGWYGHPVLYDLKSVWASAVGVMNYRGATTAAIVIVLVLSIAALVLVSRTQTLRQSPAIVALAVMAVLPPVLVYFLSLPPANLTIFAFRHLLPSTAALLLLCCYGLERISQASGKRAYLVAVCGSALLLFLGAFPTVQMLSAGPSRIPYDKVALQIEASDRGGTQAFAASDFLSEPVNFYCKSVCVQILPENESGLPPLLLLLYRPKSGMDADKYSRLIQSGYADVNHDYYTNGSGSPWGTMVAKLERRR